MTRIIMAMLRPSVNTENAPGHANIAINLGTYSHLILGMAAATARVMADALGGEPPDDRDEDASEA